VLGVALFSYCYALHLLPIPNTLNANQTMNNWKSLYDIRIWIVLFFCIRLIGITDPPLEIGHNWRQTTVTMVARNFLEVDNNIFLPRIDFAGEKTGITGMEFPFLNYLIYLIAEIFGYDHWYGRLINLTVSSLGLWYFFKLVGKYFPEKVAFYSTIVLAVSIWFQFSRKIMPDTFSMSIVIAAIYYGTQYLENLSRRNNNLSLLAYFVLMGIGVLSKLPSGYLLSIFIFFFISPRITLKRKLIFTAISATALLPVVLWYFYWVPHLVSTYGFWHFFMGKSLIQGFHEIVSNPNLTFGRFYETALKFIGFAVFLYGLSIAIIKKEWKIYYLFAVTGLSFLIVILKAGFTFSHHNYYIIPFVPVMALVAGYGLNQLKNSKIAILLLIAISVEGLANQHLDFVLKPEQEALLLLEKDMDTFSTRSDLILINSGDYPTPMYFAHRKGWVESNAKIQEEGFIDHLNLKGLKYIVILKRSFGTEIKLDQNLKILENQHYCIYHSVRDIHYPTSGKD
jgi:4-amino-4-deoxy-L-arabinose transferase-like glycosyltransferase